MPDLLITGASVRRISASDGLATVTVEAHYEWTEEAPATIASLCALSHEVGGVVLAGGHERTEVRVEGRCIVPEGMVSLGSDVWSVDVDEGSVEVGSIKLRLTRTAAAMGDEVVTMTEARLTMALGCTAPALTPALLELPKREKLDMVLSW